MNPNDDKNDNIVIFIYHYDVVVGLHHCNPVLSVDVEESDSCGDYSILQSGKVREVLEYPQGRHFYTCRLFQY